MDKNYNFERKKLVLPEYGRHIHEMVDYLLSINDRDLRSSQARVVIEVMGNINPTLRDTADFKHKLWDHLFIMSDFKLDVDSPFPTPTSEIMYPQPDKLSYPKRKIARKQYGKNIANMLLSIKNETDEQAKTALTGNIARFMRAKSFEYNQEYPNNEVIMNDIRRMSDNMITIDEVAIGALKNDYKQPHNNSKNRKNFTGKQNIKRRPGTKPQHK